MIKYRDISDIYLPSIDIDISKNRHVKRRYDTIPMISISPIYCDILRHSDPSLM